MCEKTAYRGKPAPGSKEAVKLGCKCPPLTNCHGWGTLLYGKGKYFISLDCPIHAIHTKDMEGDIV